MEAYLSARLRCYYDLEEPRSRRGKQKWPLLIALHGFQGNKDSMMRLARRIADGQMVVVSLQAPYQFWFKTGQGTWDLKAGFGWGTNFRPEESIRLHHQNVLRLIARAAKDHHADPQRVFLLGFSQACSFNYRLVFTYPGKIRGVIAVCGGLPKDWTESRRYRRSEAHVLHIAASDDEWYSPQQNLEFRRQLAERAASVDFRTYKTSHRFPRQAIPHIRRWIAQHL
jgi:phospholipase/carboxylesterase